MAPDTFTQSLRDNTVPPDNSLVPDVSVIPPSKSGRGSARIPPESTKIPSESTEFPAEGSGIPRNNSGLAKSGRRDNSVIPPLVLQGRRSS